MSLVERCWMITSKFSVIAILIITGICFGVFVYPYMKKKREAALVSIVYIGIMSVLYLIPQQIGNFSAYMLGVVAAFLVMYVQDRRNICNGVQREHNKKLNNGLPILHKVPPKRDYGRYFCIMAEKGGTSHGGLTEKLSLFFHAKKQEVNAYGR